jgi:medium-chain acyl-[acyl-carrier-protein] hydrolase
MRPLLDRPFALFGHSLGALIALELSRRLAATGGPEARHLIVSGMGAPHVLTNIEPIHQLPDREFIDALRALNGTPPEVFANEGLVDCFLEVLRADFRAAETYRCDDVRRLRHPITAFAGVHDESFRREDMEGWQDHTASRCVVRWLPGDHFFIREHEHLIVSALSALPSVEPGSDPSVAVA